MVLTVSFELLVTGLFCHRHWRNCLPPTWRQRRGVRTTRLRRPLLRCRSSPTSDRVHRLPHPTSWRCATPLLRGTGWARYTS